MAFFLSQHEYNLRKLRKVKVTGSLNMADWGAEAIRRVQVLLKKTREAYFQGRFKDAWMKGVQSLALPERRTVTGTPKAGARDALPAGVVSTGARCPHPGGKWTGCK